MEIRSSLKRKSILALAAYLAIVLATVGTVSYLVVEPPIRDQLVQNLDSRTKIISSQIEAPLNSSLGILQSIVSIGNTGRSQSLQAEMLHSLFSVVDGVAVSGGLWPIPYSVDQQTPYKSLFFNRASDGVVDQIYSWDNPQSGGYDNEAWYTSVVDKPLGTVSWSPVYIDPFTHVQMITASAPYYVDDKFAGVATIDVALVSLVEFVRLHAEEHNLGVVVRDGYGDVITEHNFQITKDIYISRNQFGQFNWNIDVVNAKRLVTEQVYDLVGKVEFGLMPIMIICVLLGYVVINRYLIEPIAIIAKKVDDSKEGGIIDFSYQSKDEIKHLIDAFNQKTVFLEQEKRKAQASTKAKSAFLATISHEIRTPMNGVLGTAQILLKTDLDDEQRKHLKTLYDSGDHMMLLLNEILDFSKIEQGHLELERAEFPLESIIGSINSVYYTLCSEKGLEFKIINHVEKERWYRSDKARLRQVLFNLLNNAVKFTASGSVEAHFDEVTVDGRNFLNIKVKDSGIGIDKTAQHKIFNPFEQAESSTTRRFGGTGLGLAIVKQITELMDGDISLQSTVGAGTTFDILLDMEICPPGELEIVEHRKLDYTGLKALIVEDNRTNTIIIKTFMSSKGFECHCVENGEAAVQEVESGQYDLILMDNHMPIKDGITATSEIRALKSKQANTLIFGCTADLFKETRERMLVAGVDYIISKPINEKELDDALHRYSSKLYQFGSVSTSKTVKDDFNTEQQLISLYIAVEDQLYDEVSRILHVILEHVVSVAHDSTENLIALISSLLEDKELPTAHQLDVLTVLLKDY
ncbi:hybrid sensor histidine kinase/response regulator [Vibrio sp. LaRot3]|uniref:hybrid sensor histidine kinase/response regulator n=1 Tax=Vibrio sp. LaRot3 TaxID=2998829 RepID=UPI0022CE2A52|nr:hybrid sensor histidine kinase/response regulator [Vibrio sp. LaRot3]MDA0147241.1 ATP-binding protein [Vibrio sp. LaRot3]